jgi:hypothetical protein
VTIQAYPVAIHHVSGQYINVKQSDLSVVSGRLTWLPGHDAATVTRTDGKTATYAVTELSWADGSGRDWPAHGNPHPAFSGTPVVPA